MEKNINIASHSRKQHILNRGKNESNARTQSAY